MPRPISTKTPIGRERSRIGISAKKLGKIAGVGVSTIQKLEAGTYPLSASVASKLGKVFGVSPQSLFSDLERTKHINMAWNALKYFSAKDD